MRRRGALLLASSSVAWSLSGVSGRAPPTIVKGLKEIAGDYDAFLLDQFGVLHDGALAIPGAVACFDELAAANKKLVVLSNTSRRRGYAIQKFPKLGFDEGKLTGFLTSGEAAWHELLHNRAGQRMLHISWTEDWFAWDPTYFDGLDVTLAPAESADFIFLQGSMCIRDGNGPNVDAGVIHTGKLSAALEETLRLCATRGLPMICANPDFQVTLPSGSVGYMPGVIASAYEELGGTVSYFGKPHPPAYAEALKLLGPEVLRSRVLMVGDSLLHDIAGANAAGIDSLLVAGGIHADELGVPDAAKAATKKDSGAGGVLTDGALERVFAARGVQPTMSTPAFRW